MHATRKRSLWIVAVGLVAACTAFAAGTAEPARGQTTAPPLTGEEFVALESPVPVGLIDVVASCPFTGQATITYTASGLATAPYPGMYSETGTVTLASRNGPITGFSAHFTIDSPVGQVEGDKQLNFPFADSCLGAQRSVAGLLADYSATITTATGTCSTQGTATVVVGEDPPVLGGEFFREKFESGTPPICIPRCPPDDDDDGDGLTNNNESLFFTQLGNEDSDFDGIADGNDDANGNGEDDEDEDDDEDDDCPDEDSDGDGEDDEDEDDDNDD